MMVFLLVASQHATYGIDSAIPRGEEAANDVDQAIYEIAPDFKNIRSLKVDNCQEFDEYNAENS